MKKLVLIKRASQTLFLFLFAYILWSTTYPLSGMIPVDSFFKTNPLIMATASISDRQLLPGLYLALIIPLLTIAFGRFFCGWICPLGTIIDAAGAFKKRKKAVKDGLNNALRLVKIFLLGAILFFSFLGINIAWAFDPIVICARFVSINFIPSLVHLINSLFIFLIQDLGLSGTVYDLYRTLKYSVLDINVYTFDSSMIILSVFLVIVSLAFILPRAWCRVLCPLGAVYSLFAKISPFKIMIDKNCTKCAQCFNTCRMGAISRDLKYEQGECTLCVDCIYECGPKSISFGFQKKTRPEINDKKGGITRKEFLFFISLPVFLSGFSFGGRKKGSSRSSLIQPPGVFDDRRFNNMCVRCGNCMKVCPTNGLQPSIFEAGIEGIWTPHLIPEIGYCEYNCNLCGNVCPTNAIPKLPIEKKKKTKLGTAKINRSICLAWRDNEHCLVCEEHCPVPEKAIKIVMDKGVPKPVVDMGLCIGCGICQNKCPVTPSRAIRVYRSM